MDKETERQRRHEALVTRACVVFIVLALAVLFAPPILIEIWRMSATR